MILSVQERNESSTCSCIHRLAARRGVRIEPRNCSDKKRTVVRHSAPTIQPRRGGQTLERYSSFQLTTLPNSRLSIAWECVRFWLSFWRTLNSARRVARSRSLASQLDHPRPCGASAGRSPMTSKTGGAVAGRQGTTMQAASFGVVAIGRGIAPETPSGV
jgi:hypothetical protein